MPNYVSPNIYIDMSKLPQPDVIETIAYEDILTRYKAQVLARNPSLAAALNLEQSPTNIILEAEAYGEMITRARVNAAARAVMLAFATGTDLDHLGALYNVQRLSATVNGTLTKETDAAFRLRIQVAPEAFSTAGSGGAYVFQAKTSDVTIRDASAIVTDTMGGVKVTIMNSGSDPRPTIAQINNARTRILQPGIKPLTDVVSVAGPNVAQTTITADVTLYPGPDAAIVIANIQAALLAIRNRISMLGYSLTRAACISAFYQQGVENVVLTSPANDVVVGPDGCVQILSAAANVLASRTT